MTQASREQALKSALLQRAPRWREAVERAQQLGSKRAADVDAALEAVEDYRLLARELATARRLLPDGRTREYLEGAYALAHAAVHRAGSHPGQALLSLLRDQIPQAAAALRRHIIWVSALFVVSALCGFWLVHTYPELIGLFASPEMISTVERGELWTEGLLNIAPSSVLSAQIFTNNIVVSLFAFCAGFLFGLGTFYIVALNGVMLGAVFAFTAQHHLHVRLFKFILAHGCVEVSVMCLSGAAGAAVGEALVRPGAATRGEAFQAAALTSGKLLFACVLLLIGCGFIEGYISPDPDFPLWTRAVVGIGYWLFMLALLKGWLFGRSRTPARPLSG
jgi:uncharacterized membrane protein SpoIIM required for sporulation